MEECAPAIVTLTTDFGLQDPYAGQLRGAVLKGCPSATVVDLTHGVPPWDVVTAAVTIRTSFAFFPAGSIHLVVVDPGVGGRRPILAARQRPPVRRPGQRHPFPARC
jgi:S-adenosylmethionine hydrolase